MCEIQVQVWSSFEENYLQINHLRLKITYEILASTASWQSTFSTCPSGSTAYCSPLSPVPQELESGAILLSLFGIWLGLANGSPSKSGREGGEMKAGYLFHGLVFPSVRGLPPQDSTLWGLVTAPSPHLQAQNGKDILLLLTTGTAHSLCFPQTQSTPLERVPLLTL